MEQATNQFTKGLQCDTHPMVLSNDTLTDCLNGTLITMNGNEVVLLNDMGNRRVDNAFLPPGYEPVGMKEYGGIIYVAAYNPITNHSQVGSFPSPERKLSPADEKTDLSAEFNFDEKFYGTKNIEKDNYYGLNFLKNDSFLIPLTKDINLHVGDKFTVYAAGLSKIKDRITNYDNIIKLFEIVTKSEYDEEKHKFKRKIEYYLWKDVTELEYNEELDNSKKRLEIIEGEIHYFLKKEVSLSEYNEEQDSNKKEIIYYLCKKSQLWTPKNREFTLQLGILNSQNEFVDITKSLVRWEELDKQESYIKENLIFGNKEDVKTVKINPGDIIITYSNTSNNNFQLDYSVDKENWESVGDYPINISLNNLYLKGKNVTVETIINNSTKEWEIIDYSNESELYQFNDGYFIPDSFISPNWEETIKDTELIQERQALPANTYAYKLVGPLYLKVTLNHVLNFEYNIDAENNEENIILTVTGNITYNCPDGTKTSEIYNPIGEYYTKDLNIPTYDFLDFILDTLDLKKEAYNYDIETELIEDNVIKISQKDKYYSYIVYSPSNLKNEKITEEILPYQHLNNEKFIFNKGYKDFEYLLNLENSYIIVLITNKYEEQNYIKINDQIYECLKFKITNDNKVIIIKKDEETINLNDSTTIIIGGNIKSTIFWDSRESQIIGAADHCTEIQVNINDNKLKFIDSMGELKELPYYSLLIDTNGEKLLSIELSNNELEFKNVGFTLFNKYIIDNITHYLYFINLTLEDIKDYSKLIFNSTNDSQLLGKNYGIVRVIISSALNYCYDYINLNNNPYGEYLLYFDKLPIESKRFFYLNTYFYNTNLEKALEIKKSDYIYISNPYTNFNFSKIYEDYTLKAINTAYPFYNLYKKIGNYCFQHKVTLENIENTDILFNSYNEIVITSIKVIDDLEIEREILEENIILFKPESYDYLYKIPSFENLDKKAIITFISNEYSPNIGIYKTLKEDKNIELISSEKTNMKYDINSNLYSLSIINKYKIPSDLRELNYIIGIKNYSKNSQDYYLKGFATKGNINFNSYHSDEVEITKWATFYDKNKEKINFRFGIKNYNESRINNIKIYVKEDDGTSSTKPEIIININKTFGLELDTVIDLTKDEYYIDTSKKIKENKAYIVLRIEYTLEKSEESKTIEEVERDLYAYDKIIKLGTKNKKLVRWFITTDLFNNFYNLLKIKDYCVPSTSDPKNIVEFEKILYIENLYISYSPNIELSNEEILSEESPSINFKDECEISYNSFKPYQDCILIEKYYDGSSSFEEVIEWYSLTEENIKYIYKRGLAIFWDWLYLKKVEIINQLETSIATLFDGGEGARYGGHTEYVYLGTYVSIESGDKLKITFKKGAINLLFKIYTFKDLDWNLKIKKGNISLNYPKIINDWIKDTNELNFMEPYDLILKKLGSTEELRINSSKKSYKIQDINEGEIKKILELGDELNYGLDKIQNNEFIVFEENNKVYIDLFYNSDHKNLTNPIHINTFESILEKYNNELTPSPNSGKEEIYMTLIPDWARHSDDYHYLIVYKNNQPEGYIHGKDEIPKEDYDYLDRSIYWEEKDGTSIFNYNEDARTKFSLKINEILSNNNKNYIRIYLDVPGIMLAKSYTDPPTGVSIPNYRLYFCKDLYGMWYPSKYELNSNYIETLKATFYLSSSEEDLEGKYQSYYQDNRYILTGNSKTGKILLFFRVPIRLIYSSGSSRLTYSLGSLHFKLKQFNTLLIQDSNTVIIGNDFDNNIKSIDGTKYILKLSNGTIIDLNSFRNLELINKLNDRDILYCDNYTNIEYDTTGQTLPIFKKVINFYNDNHLIKYYFNEKEQYSEYGYDSLLNVGADEDSVTYLILEGNFVDDRIKYE